MKRFIGLQLPLIVFAILSPIHRLIAQDQPVVFVHGLASNETAWSTVAGRLAATLKIRALTPRLSSTAYYETQSSQLVSTLNTSGFGSNTIAVGHSNGGVVSRYTARSRAFRGVVTMGSPNSGAPLVNSAPYVVAYGGILLSNVFYLSDMIYTRYGPDWRWLGAVLDGAMMLGASLGNDLEYNVLVSLGIAGGTVLGEMLPGSTFLTALSSAALQTPSKIAIGITATNYYYAGPWRAFMSLSAADNIAAGIGAAAGTLIAYAQQLTMESDPGNFDDYMARQALSNQMNYVVALLFGIDRNWCQWVSGGNACQPSDDVVPLLSQGYPGATQFNFFGPGHTQEIGASESTVGGILRGTYGVQTR